MEWLEIVRLRSEFPHEKTHLLTVLDDLFQNPRERDMRDYRIFTSTEGRDILILLTWDMQKGERSHLGSVIAEELGHFGLVAHSVWEKWQSI